MILDGALGRAGDEHQPPGTGGQRLIDRVLDQRLVDDRQHFLWTGLGRRQEACAASGYREHRGPNLCYSHAVDPRRWLMRTRMLDERNGAGDASVAIPAYGPRLQGSGLPTLAQSRIGRSAPSLTRSRRSLPGLKCGTCLPASATASPVFGLRPCRGGRKCSEKLPNPRISIRSPVASASLMISSSCLTASSTSLAGKCFCLAEMISMSSDFVIIDPWASLDMLDRAGAAVQHCPTQPLVSSILAGDLFFEKISQTGSGRRIGSIILHGLLFLVDVFRLDRQRNTAALAIHPGEFGFDFLADLEQ